MFWADSHEFPPADIKNHHEYFGLDLIVKIE